MTYVLPKDLTADVYHNETNLMADLNYLLGVLNSGDFLFAPFSMAQHGDLSASHDPAHSGESIKIVDTANYYTTNNVEAALQQIGVQVGTGGTLLTKINTAGMIVAWGITYNGRILDFTTGTYSGGAGAPAKPFTGLAEAFHGTPRTFALAPFVMTSLIYTPEIASSGSGSLITTGVNCYAEPITTIAATFTGSTLGEGGNSPGWIQWIAIETLV